MKNIKHILHLFKAISCYIYIRLKYLNLVFLSSFILLNNVFATSFSSQHIKNGVLNDTTTINTYYEKAKKTQKHSLDSANGYVIKGLNIAKENKYKREIINGNWLLANIALKQKNRTFADSIFNEILQYPNWIDSTSFCKIQIDYAHLLYLEKKTDSAIQIYQTILPYLQAKNNYELITHCFINLSKIMILKHDFEKSVSYLVEAQKLAEKNDFKTKLAIIHGTLGKLYFQEKDYEQSLKQFNRSLYCHTILNNVKNIAVCHQSIGTIYIVNNNLEKAETELQKAGKYFNDAGYLHLQLTVLNNLGVLYKRQQNYTKAMENYRQALLLSQELNNLSMQSASFLNMGQISILQNKNKDATVFLMQAFKLAQDARETDFREIYQNLAQVCELSGNYKESTRWLNRYIKHADSILNIEKYEAVEDIKEKYESEKKEILIEKISLENENKKATILRERIIAGGSALLFGSIIIFLFFLRKQYLQKIATYKILVEKNEKVRLMNEKIRNCQLNKPVSNNTQTVSKEIKQKLLEDIENLIINKFYTNIDLSLSSMAKTLNTNNKYLSQIINETFDCSFSNFVKQLRIEEAQKLLSNSSFNIYTIEVIAEKSGFKSKSVFNNAFKDFTGVTPSLYKRQKEQKTLDC